MRSASAILVSVALLAGCGQSTSTPDEAADVFRAFAQAARDEDADRLWELSSKRMKAQSSKAQLTAPSVLRNLRDDFAPVADGSVALDEELAEALHVVALEGGEGPGARAAVVRLEEGDWRVALTELDLGFGSDDRSFTVNVRPEDRDSIKARAWVDGQGAVVKRGKDTYAPTFHIAAFKPGVRPHVAVAYVEAGERAGAIAWTFE